MRVHIIPHNTKDNVYLVNTERECKKPYGRCDLLHRHVFTDDELANHDLLQVSGQLIKESEDA